MKDEFGLAWTTDMDLKELSDGELVAFVVGLQRRGRLLDIAINPLSTSVLPDSADKTDEVTLQHDIKEMCKEKPGKKNDQPTTECESEVTTLLVHNLPIGFDQDSALQWLDSQGYRDLYDFVYIFGPKKENTGSKAFINFCSPQQASRFRKQFHCVSVEFSSDKIRISAANNQGFAANYENLRPTKQDGRQPYLAKAALDTYKKTIEKKSDEKQPEEDSDWTATTLMIRNLPKRITDQSMAMKLLNKHGHAGSYDFFLFLPGKQSLKQLASGDKGLGYVFVNFLTPGKAKDCLDALHGKFLKEGDVSLSVVASRIQGFKGLQEQYSKMAEEGRVVPWVASGAAKVYQ